MVTICQQMVCRERKDMSEVIALAAATEVVIGYLNAEPSTRA